MHEHQIFDYSLENIIVSFLPTFGNYIFPCQFQNRRHLGMQFVVLHLKFELFYAFIIHSFHFFGYKNGPASRTTIPFGTARRPFRAIDLDE